MNVRELITELLQYNLDANVSLNAVNEESENICFSWINENEYTSINESKKECRHLFIETETRNEENTEKIKECI